MNRKAPSQQGLWTPTPSALSREPRQALCDSAFELPDHVDRVRPCGSTQCRLLQAGPHRLGYSGPQVASVWGEKAQEAEPGFLLQPHFPAYLLGLQPQIPEDQGPWPG